MSNISRGNDYENKANMANAATCKEISPDIFIDLDDTLWDFSGRVAEITGVPLEKMIDFRVYQNEEITPEQKEAIYSTYDSPETFERIEFYPGIERILQLKMQGLNIRIKTGCNSSEIVEAKSPQIAAALPSVPAEYIVAASRDAWKGYGRVLLAVDDNPYEIATSQASCNIMPIRPWNQTEKARKMVSDRKVIYAPVGDLALLADLIYSTAYQLLCHPFRRNIITQQYVKKAPG